VEGRKMTRQKEPEALDGLKNPRLLDSGVADEPQCALKASPHLTNNWVEEIRRLWAQGATSTLALARVVYQARRTLAYGDWARIWQPGVMPFSKRKADMLAAIGRGMGLIDEQTFSHLPRGWSVLYYLSQLGQVVVEQLVRAGAIHPGLTLQEARVLAAKHKGQEPPAPLEKLRQKLQQFEKFVVATLSEWTVEDRRWVQSRLNNLANKVALGSPTGANAGSPNLPASLHHPRSRPVFPSLSYLSHLHSPAKSPYL
jgi:hypothetical protein